MFAPLACTLTLTPTRRCCSGIEDAAAFTEARDILIDMGEYFQIQDDYLDCYGDPSVIGKIGTDIQDNKCGWLVVQALHRATAAQKEVLKANYGKDDAECIEKVKALYREMELEKVYEEYEDKSFKLQKARIAAVKHTSKAVFEALLQKIYKRSA